MKLKYALFFCFTFCYIITNAQTPNESAGWLSLSHTQKLTKKFDVLSNLVFRSSDKFKDLKTFQLRLGLNYNINDAHAVALGYLYENKRSIEEDGETVTHENRIYQQYQFDTDLRLVELSLRFRQEQRFRRETGSYKFNQRSRGSVSARIPLAVNNDFSKGLYVAIQNELFLNTQHKERDNNSIFDQNRAYVGLGYRWSKKIDTEIGYLNSTERESDGDFSINACQLTISTSL